MVFLVGKVLSVFFVILLLCASAFAAAPWDFLRPTLAAADAISPVITAIVLLISAFIFGIALLAYKKKKSQALLWVSVAFGLFVLKRILYLVDLYVSPGVFMNFAIESIFDLLILASLFLAIFRK